MLPSLPSSNVYAFKTFLGLFLAIYALTFMGGNLSDLMDDLYLFKLEAAEITANIHILNEKKDNLSKSLDLTKVNDEERLKFSFKERTENIKNDLEYREYLKFIYDYQEFIFPELSKLKKVQELTHELYIKDSVFKENADNILLKNKVIFLAGLLFSLVSVSGVILFLKGLYQWHYHQITSLKKKE